MKTLRDVFLILMLLAPSVANARSEPIRIIPDAATADTTVGFVIHHGLTPGNYTEQVYLPTNVVADGDGIYNYSITVPDQDTIYLVATAYNFHPDTGAEQMSDPSEPERVRIGLPPTPTPTPMTPTPTAMTPTPPTATPVTPTPPTPTPMTPTPTAFTPTPTALTPTPVTPTPTPVTPTPPTPTPGNEYRPPGRPFVLPVDPNPVE